jgi:hypothetical protein
VTTEVELSDADLTEFMVSGQWRCTPEELQGACQRLLMEKRGLASLLLVCKGTLKGDNRSAIVDPLIELISATLGSLG